MYKTTLLLHGGLGNQLFQFFFALKQVKCNQKFLRIIVPFSSEYSLDLLEIIDKNAIDKLEIIRCHLIFYKIIANLKKIIPPYVLRYFGVITDQNHNLDQKFIKRPFLIYGYFQNLELILEKEKITNFVESFENNKSNILENSKRLGIHIRRGDYLKKKHRFRHGLISTNLIIKKLSFLFMEFDDIYVYSDSDIRDEFLRNLKKFLGSKDFSQKNIYFSFNEGMSDKDVFIDMGKNNTLICSNSTFSFWAGYLNNTVSSIYLPQKWFSNQDIHSGLIYSRVKIY